MKFLLSPLSDQVIIITGASGEIGLMTTRMAARQGAKVVIVAKIDDDLVKLSDEINDQGGTAVYVQADMAKESDVQRVVETAIRAFGTFDTWVNITGKTTAEASPNSMDGMKRMFDVNFWGVVYGSRVAASHLRATGSPGAIINVDSFFADRPSPLQAVNSATKHAVESWTDDLRLELNKEKIPISVSFIHPRETESHNKETEALDGHPLSEGSVHAQAIAEAILYCAEHQKREMLIGPRTAITSALSSVTPRLFNKVKGVANFTTQPRGSDNNLKNKTGAPRNGHRHKLETRAQVFYEKASKHPLISTLAFAGLGASIWMWAKRKYKAMENH